MGEEWACAEVKVLSALRATGMMVKGLGYGLEAKPLPRLSK